MEKSRQELKSYFQTGDIPTEQHYADLIESCVNKVDDVSSVGTTDWVAPTLLNNFENFGSFQTSKYQDTRYRKLNGVVYIQGTIKGSEQGKVIFNLPEGFRPAERIFFGTLKYGNVAARIDILPNGDVFAESYHASWTSLNGILFIADN